MYADRPPLSCLFRFKPLLDIRHPILTDSIKRMALFSTKLQQALKGAHSRHILSYDEVLRAAAPWPCCAVVSQLLRRFLRFSRLVSAYAPPHNVQPAATHGTMRRPSVPGVRGAFSGRSPPIGRASVQTHRPGTKPPRSLPLSTQPQ